MFTKNCAIWKELLLQRSECEVSKVDTPYTNSQFVRIDKERQRWILKYQVPKLQVEIQKEISRLTEKITSIDVNAIDLLSQVRRTKEETYSVYCSLTEKDQGLLFLIA